MAEPIKLKFSLNTLSHPASKFALEKLIRSVAGLQYLKNDPETMIIADFHDSQLVGRYFTDFYSKQPLCTMTNPIPNIFLHPQLVCTTDSADFQGPITRPVSDGFRHLFTQIGPNIHLGQGIHLLRVQHAFITCHF